MSSDELTLFSYELLGLVGRNGAAPHDLRAMVRRGRMLDWAGESRYYVEPKRLARLGYLTAQKQPGKTRERTVYRLTEKGLEALSEWARTPARFTPVKSEALVRILITDLVGEAATRESLVAMRVELDELEERLDAAAARAETLPHRRKYLRLNNDYLRDVLALQRKLVDDVERELADDRAGPSASGS